MLGRKIEEAPRVLKIILIAGVVLFVFLAGVVFAIGVNAYNSNSDYPDSEYGQAEETCECCGGEDQGDQKISQNIESILKDAEKAGLSYYVEKYKDAAVSAKAKDYGCHIQVDIYKGDKVVKSLGYDEKAGIYEIN